MCNPHNEQSFFILSDSTCKRFIPEARYLGDFRQRTEKKKALFSTCLDQKASGIQGVNCEQAQKDHMTIDKKSDEQTARFWAALHVLNYSPFDGKTEGLPPWGLRF